MPEEAEGALHAEDMVQETPVEDLSVNENPPTAGYSQVAREVLAGHWGRGNIRKQRLEDAGYDPTEVQSEVDKILNR